MLLPQLLHHHSTPKYQTYYSGRMNKEALYLSQLMGRCSSDLGRAERQAQRMSLGIWWPIWHFCKENRAACRILHAVCGTGISRHVDKKMTAGIFAGKNVTNPSVTGLSLQMKLGLSQSQGKTLSHIFPIHCCRNILYYYARPQNIIMKNKNWNTCVRHTSQVLSFSMNMELK